MDIRKILSLLEDKQNLSLVKLPYALSGLSPVFSKTMMDLHYNKIYKGLVKHYDEDVGDKSFNESGAFLHDIWFRQFRNVGSRRPTGVILSLIERNHKNYFDFKKAFREAAMEFHGSGWIYLSKSGQIKTIQKNQKRTDIALLLDLWEHAYQTDYANNKGKYVDAFWRVLDWDAINKRL
jgi:Fe-Mn family superoxide dismutase